MITRTIEAFRLEFTREGNILRDRTKVKEYEQVLIKLQLCGMCEIDRYICIFQDHYYPIYN